MRTRTWVAAGLAVLIGVGAAVVSDAWADDDDRVDDDDELVVELEDVEDVLGAVEALAQDLVTPSQAIEHARAKSEGVPVEITLGSEPRDGRLVAVWEVSIVDGETLAEWCVDARTGDVFLGESESIGSAGPRLAELARSAHVSITDAATRVSDAVAGALVGLELEVEDGVLGWEARVVHDGYPSEVLIDAGSGKIVLDADARDDDEDHDEDHDEDDDDDHHHHDED